MLLLELGIVFASHAVSLPGLVSMGDGTVFVCHNPKVFVTQYCLLIVLL